MSAPEPDNARQELERAATGILSELTHRGDLPSAWTYEQFHALVAAAYGRGYVAGIEYTQRVARGAIVDVAAALAAKL